MIMLDPVIAESLGSQLLVKGLSEFCNQLD